MAQVLESSDGDLARAVALARGNGAEAAESELYRRFAPRVRLYGLRHLRDEDAARDLVQQVLLLAIEKLRAGAIRDADQIGSFILGASRTMVVDFKRRERRRERLRETYVEQSQVADAVTSVALDLDRLEECLGRLGPRERMIVLLTFYGERSTRQVGDDLAVTESNVRVIRHRAIGRLRTCMNTAGDDR